ncbi:hypothetical protein BdWA1_002741 [Babesia duncani]|uniref:Uncharacterized protein n=1 Tax=Babesia duncani TaxID=323732 RepID=A0AAD9PJT2_9APIC|nr:hypothetical protein BdWA1_002741 [Babesia duncani]
MLSDLIEGIVQAAEADNDTKSSFIRFYAASTLCRVLVAIENDEKAAKLEFVKFQFIQFSKYCKYKCIALKKEMENPKPTSEPAPESTSDGEKPSCSIAIHEQAPVIAQLNKHAKFLVSGVFFLESRIFSSCI